MNATNNAQQVQVNPIECARNALNFLSRAAFTRNERAAFDQCEGMLAAIVEGQIVLTPATKQEVAPPLDANADTKRGRPRKPNGHGAESVSSSAPVQTDALG
jgi:hypothetical protein